MVDFGLSWDRIERGMALEYCQRRDGWPVGAEMVSGAAFSCPSPTVQIVEQPGRKGRGRYLVHTLFPFRRLDQRFPVAECRSLSAARAVAFDRLRYFAAGEPLRPGRAFGIDLCRGGSHVGLEVTL